MTKQNINSVFKARQVAGSCRLSGITVTDTDLVLIQSIIEGEADGESIKASLVSEYRSSNGIPANHSE